jgi:hypothetical protein
MTIYWIGFLFTLGVCGVVFKDEEGVIKWFKYHLLPSVIWPLFLGFIAGIILMALDEWHEENENEKENV